MIKKIKNKELLLKSYKEKYKLIFKLSSEAILILNKKGKVVEINDNKLYGLLGYKKNEIIGKSILNFPFIPSESKQIIKKNFFERMMGKKISPYDLRFLDKKGQDLWIKITVQTIKDKQKNIIGSFVMLTDITKYKNTELKIKKLQNRQEQILNSIPAMIFLKNLDNNIIELNHAFTKITGLSKKKIEGKDTKKLWPKDTKKYWGDDDAKIIKLGKSKKNIIKGFDTPKGRKWFKTDKILYKDEKGNISGIIGFSLDITREKEAGIKYETLFNTLVDAVMFLKPPKWNFTGGNPSTLKMFGLKDEEEFTSHTPYFYSPEYQPNGKLSSVEAKKRVAEAMKKGRNTFEWVHKRKNGEEFPAMVFLEKIGINGEKYLQATVRDVTEQKKKEEKVKQAKELLEKYLETAGVILGVLDGKANIVMINKKGYETLEYKEKTLIGKNWINNLVPKRDKKQVKNFFNKLMSGKISKIIPFENALLTRKGQEKTFAFENNILRDSNNKIIGVLFSAFDITQQKKTNKEIKEKSKQLEKINEFFLHREERIIELKEKIKKLEKRIRRK